MGEQLAFSSVLVWIASEFVSQLTSRSTEMPKANAQRALGLFGEPSYLGIGDPYDPPKDNAGRHRGVNFTTSPVKKGNVTKYVCFDTTFRRVSEGDTYKMPGANERKSRKEAWEKCTTSNGFVFSHPPKRRTGLGECSGNFNTFSKWQPNNLLIDYTHKLLLSSLRAASLSIQCRTRKTVSTSLFTQIQNHYVEVIKMPVPVVIH